VSSNKIKRAALFHFANNGYDGTSLAIIASEVGIKKQSIYTHFANKDDLFLTIMNEVLIREQEYIQHFFSTNAANDFKQTLYQFLQEYRERYKLHSNTKFLLRMGFLPPAHLLEQVMDSVYSYYDEMERILINFFEVNRHLLTIPVMDAVIAFIGLSDSILVELLYSGDERFQRRLQASWNILWQGMTTKGED
jgi:AcrR family transcriptional regulator